MSKQNAEMCKWQASRSVFYSQICLQCQFNDIIYLYIWKIYILLISDIYRLILLVYYLKRMVHFKIIGCIYSP